MSTGWLAVLTAEASAGLGGFVAVLKAQLIAEDAIHADETGARISGAQFKPFASFDNYAEVVVMPKSREAASRDGLLAGLSSA